MTQNAASGSVGKVVTCTRKSDMDYVLDPSMIKLSSAEDHFWIS